MDFSFYNESNITSEEHYNRGQSLEKVPTFFLFLRGKYLIDIPSDILLQRTKERKKGDKARKCRRKRNKKRGKRKEKAVNKIGGRWGCGLVQSGKEGA